MIINNLLSNNRKGIIFVDNDDFANQRVRLINNTINSCSSYPIHFSDVSTKADHSHILIKKNKIIGDTIPYNRDGSGGSADQISIFGSKKIKIKKNESIGGDMGITLTRC